MPVTLATPPASVLAEIARTLPRIARSAAVRQRAPEITLAASRFTLAGGARVARSLEDVPGADALSLPVYVLGLEELAAGRLEAARLSLWSHIVTTEAGVISADVSSDNGRFAEVSNGAAAGRARALLLGFGTSGSGDAADGEAAELRIPALHTSLLWVRGRGEAFEVIETALPELSEERRYTAVELIGVLRPLATARLRDSEGEG